jgi:hypothetical protein
MAVATDAAVNPMLEKRCHAGIDSSGLVVADEAGCAIIVDPVDAGESKGTVRAWSRICGGVRLLKQEKIGSEYI